ncbi:MAG: zinc ribbon domain-containing protein [Chloroflexaceae bacterium]|nr:zinc ribbon domain-containing protein [Chloroflexaceae bacterium]
MPRQETSITIAGREIPMQQIKQVGQTVALSLAALAAEAGMAWLRRRVTQINMPQPVAQQQIVPTQNQPSRSIVPSSTANSVVTIISQRVVEVWEQGNLTKQTVERHVWKREG